MAADRRSLAAAALMFAVLPVGCANKAKKQTQEAATHSPKARPQAPRKAVPIEGWDMFRQRFMTPEGRIVDTGNGGISHSEGQGYALLMAEASGDRASFDLLWKWTDATLSRKDVRLFSWRFDPHANPQVTDPNNATDGDILIAWALLRASQRWRSPDYAKASLAIREAILVNLVKPAFGRAVLLPALTGFANPQSVTVNPSYYIWPALDAFRAADPNPGWRQVIGDGEALLTKARFGPHALPTDWIDVHPGDVVTPAANKPARFGFDAVRIPFYLLWSGRKGAVLGPFRTWWAPGVQGNGTIPAWIDVATGEAAPYPLSPGGMAVAQATLGRPATAGVPLPDDYYAAALLMLTRIRNNGR